MATTAQTFFPSTTNQDFTAGGEVDIRKLAEAVGASDNTTVANFGTAAAEIILDPYSPRNTTGTTDAPNLGWAINRLGTDGMDSTATNKRRILAGNWTFNGRLGATLTLTSAYRMRVRVYRVSSTGARTLLFGPVDSATVSPTAAGNDVSITTSQSQIILEANETILVSFAIEKTNTSALAEAAEFRLNDTLGNDASVAVPTPGVRTDYLRSHSVTDSITAALGRRTIFTAKSVSLTLTVAFSRLITAFRSFSVSQSLSVAIIKTVKPAAKAVTINLATAVTKYIKPVAMSVSLSLTTAVLKYIKPAAKSVTLSLTTAYQRAVTAYRSFSVSLSLTTAFSRSLIAVRAFTDSLSLTVALFVKIKQDILNRLAGGGTTIIKKIQNIIFDD